MSSRTLLNLTDVERDELRALVRAPRMTRALADRCRVVLRDDRGLAYAQVGAKFDMRVQTVLEWRSRFLTHRLPGLKDKPRPGVEKKITRALVVEIVRKTLQERLPDATHRSLRPMAAVSGVPRFRRANDSASWRRSFSGG